MNLLYELSILMNNLYVLLIHKLHNDDDGLIAKSHNN